MFEGKKFYLFLAVYLIFLMVPAYWLPLFESTEARYGEISREMLASLNFMEPYYNGIKHFHKPPLTYWLNAFGMYLFGINGFGARIFGALAAVLTLYFTRKTAMTLTGDGKTADKSVLVLASSILFLMVSRIVSTDVYLMFFAIAALYHMFAQMYGRNGTSNALMTGIYIGLGFLTKGPVIFLFTLLPFFTAKFFDRGHRKVFTPAQVFYGFCLFVLTALPWYLYVVSINDGLLEYFLKDQTIERVATDKFSRSKPFYFFFMVFSVTFFPWILYLLRNFRFTDKLKSGKAIYLYVIMPFIVFQLSTSKLGTYLLPFFPVAAIIAALNTDSKLLKRISILMTFVLGVAVCAVPFVEDFVRPYAYLVLPFGVGYLLLAGHLAYWGYYKRNFVRTFAMMILLFSMAVYGVLPLVGPYLKGYRILAEEIKEFDPQGQYSVLVYRHFLPIMSFYLNDIKPIAFSKTRETQFQKEEEYADYLIDTDEALSVYLGKNKELILVSRNEHYKDFEERSGYTCTDISFLGEEKRASFCRAPELTD